MMMASNRALTNTTAIARPQRAALVVVAVACLVALAVAIPSPALAAKGGVPGPAGKGGSSGGGSETPPPAPVLQSLSLYAGSPGTQITLLGSGFGDTKGKSWVGFDTVKAPIISWSDTVIVVNVPNKSTPGYVGVNVGDVWSNGMYFIPSDPPVIASLDKTSGAAGTPVTITGTAFGDGTTGSVTFDGISATIVSWSDTAIVAQVPAGAGVGYVGVWKDGLCSNGVLFTAGSMPTIDSVSEPMAVVGSEVVVRGKNFGQAQGNGKVTISGVEVAPTTWSDGEVRFVVPANAKKGYVGVWQDDVSSNGKYFMPAPRVASLSSWWGPAGSEITLSGEGFGDLQEDGRVTFDGVEAAVVSWSATSVVAIVPEGAQIGFVGVWKGPACSNGMYFLPMTQATISTVDTTTVAPGSQIVIDGQDFDSLTPENGVAIGGVWLEVLTWTDTQIVARVPGAMASGYLGVWKRGVASNGVWVDVSS